ncbi:PepSY domain-containing protein [Actinoplanes sp. RD1]|uniref:PepSY domain-containing protein n=1 Tax=Actinoplanes sp. RD1 TaxID=3064538 RepID=UPI002741CBB7|nr:PepSY domain-containing protein [Actinoplanes sp. RD1]
MIRIRTAAALAAGTVAALAVGGVALASDGGDDISVPMKPNGDVITASPGATDDSGFDDSASPSPSATDDPASPSPSASSSTEASPRPSGSASSGAARAADSGLISIDAAKMIALRAAGGGYVESIERETEHGRAVWDVDVVRNGVEHDIDVDRATGAITRHRTDDDNSSSSGRSSDDHSGSGSDGSDDNRGDDDHGDDHGRHGGDDRGDDHGRHGDDD